MTNHINPKGELNGADKNAPDASISLNLSKYKPLTIFEESLITMTLQSRGITKDKINFHISQLRAQLAHSHKVEEKREQMRMYRLNKRGENEGTKK